MARDDPFLSLFSHN